MPRGPRRRLLIAGPGLGLVAVALLLALVVGGGGRRSARKPPTAASPPTTTSATSAAPPPARTSIPPGPPARAAPAGLQLGASVNVLFNSRAFSSAQVDAQLRALRATGAGIARSDASWEATEPSPPTGGVHHYLWAFADLIVRSLAAHGIQWLPIVDYSAPWAGAPGGGVHPPPASPGDYAAYAAALAARYGPTGMFWRSHPELPLTPVHTYEIWNEPDNPTFWSPRPDPARYAELYARARAAIADVDPAARVVIGGLIHPEAFLPAVLAARPELRGHLDGIAIHPYAMGPQGVLVRVRDAREVLRGLALGNVPLYVTEFGWATRPPHTLNWASPSQRPSDISSTLAALAHSDCGLAAVVLYTWVTLERNPADREDWYGISPASGGASADTAAFASGLHDAAAPAPKVRACAGPG